VLKKSNQDRHRVGVQKGISREDVIAAYDAQGMRKNISELARIFGCSTATIYYHLSRAGVKLDE
jgi:DNA-binding CsgD family transcriptional regulator